MDQGRDQGGVIFFFRGMKWGIFLVIFFGDYFTQSHVIRVYSNLTKQNAAGFLLLLFFSCNSIEQMTDVTDNLY
jgi:hypothetical protein